MEYKITISERAKINLENVIEYLKINWTEKVLKDFLKKLQKKTDLLKQNPFMFANSELKIEVRKCLITKHNALYYKVKNDEVEIITIHDTRKDPKSLKITK
jgi:plasmid stabilization system protein ParE